MKSPPEPDAEVLIVDDDDSVRASLERLLASEGFGVRTFASARSFLESLPAAYVPCCVILDLNLPELDGLAVQQRLQELDSPPAVLFLTGRGDIPTSVRALKAGALEFFTKPFRPADLVTAVRSALLRQREQVVERRHLSELRERYATLTTREREVMAGVVQGLLNKQIAARLGTSEVTVKEQRARALRKMSADSAADLVRMALRLGVADPTEELPEKGSSR
jgi:FixJ family two-component response regulator